MNFAIFFQYHTFLYINTVVTFLLSLCIDMFYMNFPILLIYLTRFEYIDFLCLIICMFMLVDAFPERVGMSSGLQFVLFLMRSWLFIQHLYKSYIVHNLILDFLYKMWCFCNVKEETVANTCAWSNVKLSKV